MSRETERKLLAQHLAAVWDDSDGPIAWPNQPFETPEKHLFAVFNIVDRGSTRQSLGIAQFFNRHHGSIQLDIYTPQDAGTTQSRQIADRLALLYDSIELITDDGEKLTFGTPSGRTLPTNEVRAANLDDNWDRYVFEAPFYRDQHIEK